MTSRRSIGALLSALFWLAAGFPVWAQPIERVGNFRDWSAFRYTDGNETVCYAASEPKKAEGDYKKRGDVFVIVTHRPASNRIGELSIVAGYDYKKDSAVEVKIGSKSWNLFTEGGNAWASTAEDDRGLVGAMKAGSGLVVKGTSSRGTPTTDTYSLLGFSKAYAAIGKACGL